MGSPLTCCSGGLSSMYHEAKRNTGVGRLRYGGNRCKRISLVLLILKVFTAVYLCKCASGSENEYSKIRFQVGSVKASGSFSFNTSRKSLDAILQNYAFKSFVRPRTGVPYDAPVPSNVSGIKLQAVRLKSGSLYNRGAPYNEFNIRRGVLEQPYVERLVLVYQNLGNWSNVFYKYRGYDFVGPVLGLLAYDASNLSAMNLPELQLFATKQPISIQFPEVRTGSAPMCISFYSNGSVSLSNVSAGNVCLTRSQGHFALIAESLAPAPAPLGPVPSIAPPASIVVPPEKKKKKSNTWKIVVGSVLGAVVLLVLLVLMGCVILKYGKKARIARMERQADQGEALQTTLVGSSRTPAAGGTRTQPMLENEYVA